MNFEMPLLSNLTPSTQRSVAMTAGALAACLLVVFLGVLPKQKKIQLLHQEADALHQTVTSMLADIATTEIYTHVDHDRLRAVHQMFHPRP